MRALCHGETQEERNACQEDFCQLSLSGQKEVYNYPDNNSNRGTICLLFSIQTQNHYGTFTSPLFTLDNDHIASPLLISFSRFPLFALRNEFAFLYLLCCVLHQSKQAQLVRLQYLSKRIFNSRGYMITLKQPDMRLLLRVTHYNS